MQLFSWDAVRTEVMNAKIWRKVIAGERAMVAQVFIAKGAVVPTHQHESEQFTYIMEGALEFDLEGRRVVVRSRESGPWSPRYSLPRGRWCRRISMRASSSRTSWKARSNLIWRGAEWWSDLGRAGHGRPGIHCQGGGGADASA